MIIKRIGPLSCAKIAGITYACLGLLLGVIFSSMALIGSFASLANSNSVRSPVSALGGVAVAAILLVASPIAYGVFGFVSALLGAWVYNLFARHIGGIEIQLEAAAVQPLPQSS